jgi:hypothetical protein
MKKRGGRDSNSNNRFDKKRMRAKREIRERETERHGGVVPRVITESYPSPFHPRGHFVCRFRNKWFARG